MRVDQKPIGCLLIEEIISCTHILRVGVAGHEDSLFHANLVAEVAYRRSLFFTPNASENASRTIEAYFLHRVSIPYRRRAFPVPSASE